VPRIAMSACGLQQRTTRDGRRFWPRIARKREAWRFDFSHTGSPLRAFEHPGGLTRFFGADLRYRESGLATVVVTGGLLGAPQYAAKTAVLAAEGLETIGEPRSPLLAPMCAAPASGAAPELAARLGPPFARNSSIIVRFGLKSFLSAMYVA